MTTDLKLSNTFYVFLQAARSYGYTLLTRSPTYCAVFTPKEEVLEYDVLHVLEFDSERKCMSIVVKERKEGAKVTLYSKGADSAIYAKLVHPAQSHRRVFSLSTSSTPVSPNPLSPSSDGVQREKPMSLEQRQHEAFVKRLTQDHLDMYARLGLRILCLARRVR
jgi:magnesium-transporting ATPase (P-type)